MFFCATVVINHRRWYDNKMVTKDMCLIKPLMLMFFSFPYSFSRFVVASFAFPLLLIIHILYACGRRGVCLNTVDVLVCWLVAAAVTQDVQLFLIIFWKAKEHSASRCFSLQLYTPSLSGNFSTPSTLLWFLPRLFVQSLFISIKPPCLYPLNLPESPSFKAQTQTEEADKG